VYVPPEPADDDRREFPGKHQYAQRTGVFEIAETGHLIVHAASPFVAGGRLQTQFTGTMGGPIPSYWSEPCLDCFLSCMLTVTEEAQRVSQM
jgi:hypothetical protein